MASPGWASELARLTPPGEEPTCYCLGYAGSLARRVLPSSGLVRLASLDELKVSKANETSGPEAAAARAGDVVVAPRAHPATKGSKIWMSPYHIELVGKLLAEGYELELLDEQNNLVRKLKEEHE